MKESLKNLFKKNLEGLPNWFWFLLLTTIPICLLSRILFTNEIVRASDIITQYMWGALDYGKSLPSPFEALWIPYINFGSDTAVSAATRLLPDRFLVYMLFPFPANMAWEVVIHLIFAGIGSFIYCRILGLSRFSSFLASLFFMLSSELVTLINAGHFQKLNTISWTPWILIALEKGLQERKLFYFLITGGALAIQFIEMHWQISFYTCLAVGFYFIFRVISIYIEDIDIKESGRLTIYAVLMVIIFFTASSVSFLPVYSWSKTTERAGGMKTEEGMSWSMPPEEILTYAIPGFFGLSRKEAGYDPGYIDIHYWGRMIFTQTSDYMGILPLVMAAAGIMYRRDWYTRFFMFLTAFSLIVALGKYTPVYTFMYNYLPGFSTFRVPKMILFLFAFALSVMAGFGVQWLLFDEDGKKTQRIRKIIYFLVAVLGMTALLTLYAYVEREGLIQTYKSQLSVAFRWAQPPDIAHKRFMNIIWGSISFMAMLGIAITFLWLNLKEKVSRTWLILFASLFFIVDVWMVNGRFIVTVPSPPVEKNEVINFLERDRDLFRLAPLAGEDSFYYAHFKVPVVSSYVAVSEKNYAEYRNRIDLSNRLLDLMNVKYITLPKNAISNPPLGGLLMDKYQVIFNEDPNIVVLMNLKALPRAYPVHQIFLENDDELIFNILNHSRFNPWEMAVVEENPPVKLPPQPISSSLSSVRFHSYSNDTIELNADMAENGLLVLSEKYYPGWKVYVDGKEDKIYKTNYLMRGVYLSKGKHNVSFLFDPWAYKVGLWLSSATFLVLVVAVVLRVKRRANAPR